MVYNKKECSDKILGLMKEGRSLASILNGTIEGLPCYKTFFDWLNADKELSKDYARAILIRADVHAEQMLEIADATEHDMVLDPTTGKPMENHNVINRDRLRIDTRKWNIARMNPAKYSEKHITENLNINVDANDKELTPERIKQMREDFDMLY